MFSSVIIDAEYDEIDSGTDELDLAGEDSLPWLEAEEEDDRAGTVDTSQLFGLFAILAVVGLAVVGSVWFVSNYERGPTQIADGSTIAAPEGPYKQRPEEAGGRVFAGTGDVAPGVGQGESPDARIADSTGAGSGDQDLNIAMPVIAGEADGLGSQGSGSSANAESAASTAKAAGADKPSTGAASESQAKGVGVQLAAYSSRARAEQGWRELSRKSSALSGVRYRVVEGRVDNATVYRLQAVAGSRSEADTLCRTLKSQGLDCQVKP